MPDASYVRGYHAGIDFGCPEGTPVYAAADGTVVSVRAWGEYGNLLTLAHEEGIETWYAHLQALPDLLQGQYVAQGQVVARSGNTGRSTGPHLHWQILIGGEPVDPLPYLSVGGPVR